MKLKLCLPSSSLCYLSQLQKTTRKPTIGVLRICWAKAFVLCWVFNPGNNNSLLKNVSVEQQKKDHWIRTEEEPTTLVPEALLSFNIVLSSTATSHGYYCQLVRRRLGKGSKDGGSIGNVTTQCFRHQSSPISLYFFFVLYRFKEKETTWG